MKLRSSGAYTLLEVLMTGAILALFMGMVCECLVRMHKAHQTSSIKLNNLRAASLGLDRLVRELRCSDKLYLPDPTAPPMSTFNAFDASGSPVVFRYHVAGGPAVVGYRRQASEQTLYRYVYRPDFDPADATRQVVLETRKVAEAGELFQILRIDPNTTNGVPFLRADLKLTTELQTMSVEVRVRSL